MPDYPWTDLEPPESDLRVRARRVDAQVPYDFFWAVGHDDSPLLFIDYSSEHGMRDRLPGLRTISVREESTDKDGFRRLIFRLEDTDLQSVFFRYCADIVQSTEGAASETEALSRVIARAWHWHYLLSSGRPDVLASHQQQGLIAELIVLRDVVLHNLDTESAIRFWTGPTGAAKDFELGLICLEVKARRPGSRSSISISSEHQLDGSGFEALYLYVVDVVPVADNVNASFTLSGLVAQLRDFVQRESHQAVETFDSRLIEVGFNWIHDYNPWSWTIGSIDVFRVSDQFPAIVPAQLMPGVSRVRYTLDLNDCSAYAVSLEEPVSAIRRSHHATDSR